MPKIYQDGHRVYYRYRPGMRIPDYVILLEDGTHEVYYKYNKTWCAKGSSQAPCTPESICKTGGGDLR